MKLVLLHPLDPKPITLYVVVVVGLTAIDVADEVVFHKYDAPPAAVNVAVAPTQIKLADVLALMIGNGFTVTVLIADTAETQPTELVPIIEYVVVTDGVTLFEPPEKVYVNAPLGIIVNVLPAHILPELTAIIGSG